MRPNHRHPGRSKALFAAWVAGVLAIGCGGGGGSSGGDPPDPDAATYSMGEPSLLGTFTYDVLSLAAKTFDLAQFAVDVVHRFSGVDGLTVVTSNCAHSGTVSLQLEDRDGDRKASVGDSIVVTLDQCGLPVLKRAVTGAMRVDLLSTASRVESQFVARMTLLGGGVEMMPVARFNTGLVPAATMKGALDVQWSESMQGVRLAVVSSPGIDFSIVGGAFIGASLKQVELVQSVRYDTATNTATLAFILDHGSAGILRVSTPIAAQGGLHVMPRNMQIIMGLARGMRIRVEQEVSPQVLTTAILEDRGGSFVHRALLSEDHPVASFVRDIRVEQDVLTYTTVPWTWRPIHFWRNRLCDRQLPPAGAGNSYVADALFHRPVKAVSAPTEDGAAVHLQFGGALSEGSPELVFRFDDQEASAAPVVRSWSVATTVERHGALLVVRPVEPLRAQRNYVLFGSTDGVNWGVGQTIRFADGDLAEVFLGAFDVFPTLGPLRVDGLAIDSAVVSGGAPARLRSSVSDICGSAVSSYRWHQVSGPPVRLTTPDALNTEVALDAGALLEVEEAQIQLTVRGTSGHSDRVRFTLKVGNRASRGAALYAQTNYGDPAMTLLGRMDTGSGSFFVGPALGEVWPRVQAASEGGSGAAFGLYTRDGGPLATGRYAEVGGPPVQGRISMSHRVNCDGPGSLVGTFDILDLEYALDGTISRLAVDFDQWCQTGERRSERGSYRYRSSLPLRP